MWKGKKKIEKKHRRGKYRERNTKRQKGRKEMWKGTKKNGEEERGKRYMGRSEERWKNTEKRNKHGRIQRKVEKKLLEEESKTKWRKRKGRKG